MKSSTLILATSLALALAACDNSPHYHQVQQVVHHPVAVSDVKVYQVQESDNSDFWLYYYLVNSNTGPTYVYTTSDERITNFRDAKWTTTTTAPVSSGRATVGSSFSSSVPSGSTATGTSDTRGSFSSTGGRGSFSSTGGRATEQQAAEQEVNSNPNEINEIEAAEPEAVETASVETVDVADAPGESGSDSSGYDTTGGEAGGESSDSGGDFGGDSGGGDSGGGD